jgi:hypothetical protein
VSRLARPERRKQPGAHGTTRDDVGWPLQFAPRPDWRRQLAPCDKIRRPAKKADHRDTVLTLISATRPPLSSTPRHDVIFTSSPAAFRRSSILPPTPFATFVRRQPLPSYSLAIERAHSGVERLSFRPSSIDLLAEARRCHWVSQLLGISCEFPRAIEDRLYGANGDPPHSAISDLNRQKIQEVHGLGVPTASLTKNPSDSF